MVMEGHLRRAPFEAVPDAPLLAVGMYSTYSITSLLVHRRAFSVQGEMEWHK